MSQGEDGGRQDTGPSRQSVPTRAELLRLPEWLAKRIYPAVIVVVLALLVLHTSGWDRVDVDTTSVALIGLLLLLPLVHSIRRFKVGDFFEAEIEPEDVQRLRAKAAELPALTEERDEPPDAVALDVIELVRRDPVLGLAKLRIDLETELRRRFDQLVADPTRGLDPKMRADRRQSAGAMLGALQDADAIPPEVASTLRDVLLLANRVVHGEYVRADVALEIAELGLRALDALRAEGNDI
jgi:hypothetical protein